MAQSYYSRADIKKIMTLVRNHEMGTNEATNRMVTNARKPLKRD